LILTVSSGEEYFLPPHIFVSHYINAKNII